MEFRAGIIEIQRKNKKNLWFIYFISIIFISVFYYYTSDGRREKDDTV